MHILHSYYYLYITVAKSTEIADVTHPVSALRQVVQVLHSLSGGYVPRINAISKLKYYRTQGLFFLQFVSVLILYLG